MSLTVFFVLFCNQVIYNVNYELGSNSTGASPSVEQLLPGCIPQAANYSLICKHTISAIFFGFLPSSHVGQFMSSIEVRVDGSRSGQRKGILIPHYYVILMPIFDKILDRLQTIKGFRIIAAHVLLRELTRGDINE